MFIMTSDQLMQGLLRENNACVKRMVSVLQSINVMVPKTDTGKMRLRPRWGPCKNQTVSRGPPVGLLFTATRSSPVTQ